jgi:hypothetical protein
MTVAEVARSRGISEVLHYTSSKGVMGSVIVDALLARQQVEQNESVRFIYEGVWERSRDIDWIDYISMSLTEINSDLFARSRRNHPDWWWAVMSFPPGILDDDGVVFTTTNNAYTETCVRGPGLAGFEAMFADAVPWGHYGSVARRYAGLAESIPTHDAAEVLYPTALPLARLQALYLRDESKISLINSWCEIYERPALPIQIAPAIFD